MNYKIIGLIAGIGVLYYFMQPKKAKAAEKPPSKPEGETIGELPGKEEPLDDEPPVDNGPPVDIPPLNDLEDIPKPVDDASYLGDGLEHWNHQDVLPDLESVGKFLQAFKYLTDYKFCIENGKWVNNDACKAYVRQFQKDYNTVINWWQWNQKATDSNYKPKYIKNSDGLIRQETIDAMVWIILEILDTNNIKCINFHDDGWANCGKEWGNIVYRATQFIGSGFDFNWPDKAIFPEDMTFGMALMNLGYTHDWKAFMFKKDGNYYWQQDAENAAIIREFQKHYNVMSGENNAISGVLDANTIHNLYNALSYIQAKLGPEYVQLQSCMPMPDADYPQGDSLEVVEECGNAWQDIINEF